MQFPVSGVTIFPLVPLLVALVVSLFTSTAGVSGAFLLLPFQVSVLGFSGPAVTPTNHLFNVVAIPSGVIQYIREGRMVWPLTSIIIIGTVPGVVVGSLARIYLLPDARRFSFFMGLVLLYIGGRLMQKIVAARRAGERPKPAPGAERVTVTRFDLKRIEYLYSGKTYGVSTPSLLGLTAVVGVVGGAYGVGGGAIISPILVSLYDLPVHTIAGATLTGTCLTSIVGVGFFTMLGPLLGRANLQPDWLLGGLFGLGGLLGMNLGARMQKRLPARAIEVFLALLVSGLALRYIVGFLLTMSSPG